MKKGLINFRTSQEDETVLEMAAAKFEQETGKKPMKSRTIMAAVEQFATSEPEMFHCNRQAILETEMHIEYGRNWLQSVHDEFRRVTNYSLSFDQLQTMLIGLNSLGSLGILKEAIEQMATGLIYTDQKNRYPELNFSMDQVKLPDLSSILDAAMNFNFPWIQTFDRPIFWNVYNIEDGKITVSQAEVEKICECYRMYASTPEERAKLAEVKKLCRMLDGFIKNVSKPAMLDIPGLVYYDRFSGRFEPSNHYVKYQL